MAENKNVKKYIFDYKMGIVMFISLVFAIIPVGICFLYYHFTNNIFNFKFEDISTIKYVIFIVLMFAWMVLHEIIHGLAYQINGANSKNITYGCVLEKGIFYCKCGEFVDKKNIIMSLLSPFVLIGVITLIIGLLINSVMLIALSIVNISGAGGDLTMFWFFIHRDNDLRFKELGDSTRFCLETKEDLRNKKLFGVKLVKEVEDDKEIEEETPKKITITKGSMGFLIFFAIILIIDIVLEILIKAMG